MQRLNLPPFELRLSGTQEKPTIFDALRRKYVALTPEEWVRQHFVHYLIDHKGYPKAYLANEIELAIGGKRLRCDSVLYGCDLKPRMIVEYKSPAVSITQRVFNQIVAYNRLLHVGYLVVSNGLAHYCLHMDYDSRQYTFLKDIPNYDELCNGPTELGK